ncbi:flagellar protein FlaG [Lentibacillus halodurans]|uniref:Flagellar protein FlaG n=1 Tax=Lentibacillus halodurans TaxID=237679 RepID=A0A1I0WI32_9BACI|nr:flagellar protein FlaG [Lentibacillus halodurans]SFA88301.1 flagellar protein FlaG [Lentibacillus halodurans]
MMKLEYALTAVHPLQNEQNSKRMTSAAKEKIAENSNNTNTALDQEHLVDKDQAKTIVSKLNELMKPLRTNIQFEYHEKLEDYFVKVVNRETDEVIREIPPEKMLDMYAAMAEFMGFLVDEKI